MKATFTYLFGYRSTKNIDYWGKQIWSRNILLLCCLFQNFILPGITFPIVPLINDYVSTVVKNVYINIYPSRKNTSRHDDQFIILWFLGEHQFMHAQDCTRTHTTLEE